MKFGTILYQKGGDIMTSLSWALGSPNITDDKSPYIIGQDNQTHNEESVLNEVGHIINNLLHEESKKLSSAK